MQKLKRRACEPGACVVGSHLQSIFSPTSLRWTTSLIHTPNHDAGVCGHQFFGCDTRSCQDKGRGSECKVEPQAFGSTRSQPLIFFWTSLLNITSILNPSCMVKQGWYLKLLRSGIFFLVLYLSTPQGTWGFCLAGWPQVLSVDKYEQRHSVSHTPARTCPSCSYIFHPNLWPPFILA